MLMAGSTLCLIVGWAVLARAEKPNILFILTDDQGWPTLGCYGNKLVPTPHLDNLASEGLRLTAAYVMPQCTPTRAALLTGQHTARIRMWHVIPGYGYPYARLQEPRYNRGLPRDSFTVAKGLRAAGYVTGIIGKWHVTANADGDYAGLNRESATYYGFDVSVPSAGGEAAQGDKGVDRFTEEAIRFIEENRDRPWFLYLAYHTIHGPVLAPDTLVQKYRAAGAPDTGLHNATYLAAIEHLDRAVGRLLSGIESCNLRDRTLVVFLSDNGGIHQIYQAKPFLATGDASQETPTTLAVNREEFSNAPLRAGKGSHYEGGIRVPCIVRWPGVTPPGTVSDTPVHITDWLPTLLEAAGSCAPASHSVDGISLLPLLRGGQLPERELFWYMPFYEVRWGATPCAVIREGDWKLIEFFGDAFDWRGRYDPGHRLELFHLQDDPGESRNLADAEPARAQRMRDRLRTWMQSVGAEIPGPNPQFSETRQLLETRAER
ncbi:MAG: sulfatase [Thermoguttaceae bacterium]